jgi:Transposase
MPTGPSRNSPSLRSRRGMHRRTVTGVSERTFARRNSSTNCLISHSPRTQRLVKEAVRDAGRPGRGSSPRSSRLAPDGHLRGRLASGPAVRLAGPGRHGRAGPRRGYASALIAPLGHATVGDHFHAIRLANAVTDQARRQVKQVTLGHRGHTYDPPYRIRKLLVTAAEQLTERRGARLRARDTTRIERGANRSANLDSTRWPLSWGAASRYRTTCRCGPAAHRPRPSFGTLQVPPRDATDVTDVATAGRWARHQT